MNNNFSAEDRRRAFYIGARRGLWQANMLGLPFVIAISVYKQYYWIVLASAALLALVVYTWPRVR